MTDISYIAKAGLVAGTGCLVVNGANALGLKCVIWGSHLISKIPSPGILAAGITGVTAGLAAEGTSWVFFREGDISNAMSKKLQDMGFEKKAANRLLLVATLVIPFFITTLAAPSIAWRLGQEVSYKAAACYAIIDLSVYAGLRLVPTYIFDQASKGIEYLKAQLPSDGKEI